VSCAGKPKAAPIKDSRLKFLHRELTISIPIELLELMVHEVAKHLLRKTPNDTLTLSQKRGDERSVEMSTKSERERERDRETERERERERRWRSEERVDGVSVRILVDGMKNEVRITP
jgi:hypothetical protein